MDIASLIALALSFALALLCSWAILVPFFGAEQEPVDATDGRRREDERRELLAREESVLDALEDVEQDFHSGKLSEQDYSEAKSELTEEAGTVFTRLDALAGAKPSESPVTNISKARTKISR